MNIKGTLKSFSILVLVAVALILPFVLASNTFTFSNGALNTSVNESSTNLFTININNTDTTSNITNVNVTLPVGFTFIFNSNASDAVGSNFTNTSNLLLWQNSTVFLVNASQNRTFSFNATAGTTPGLYVINITTFNTTTVVFSTLNITINDTTAPSFLNFSSPTAINNTNLSQTNITVNFTATDNGAIDTVKVFLYNSTALVNTSITRFTGLNTTISYYLDFTGLTDDVYFVNASVNDSGGRVNGTIERRTINLDTTAPSISLVKASSSTDTELNLEVSITEALSGLTGTCTTSRSGSSVSGTGLSQTVTEDELGCSTSYSYTITCIDHAGNSGSKTSSFETDSCGLGGGSFASSTGSSSGSSTVTNTTSGSTTSSGSSSGSSGSDAAPTETTSTGSADAGTDSGTQASAYDKIMNYKVLIGVLVLVLIIVGIVYFVRKK